MWGCIPAVKSRTTTYMWQITSGSSQGYTSTILSLNRLHYFHRLIAYEVISMRGNRAELPDFMLQVVPF